MRSIGIRSAHGIGERVGLETIALEVRPVHELVSGFRRSGEGDGMTFFYMRAAAGDSTHGLIGGNDVDIVVVGDYLGKEDSGVVCIFGDSSGAGSLGISILIPAVEIITLVGGGGDSGFGAFVIPTFTGDGSPAVRLYVEVILRELRLNLNNIVVPEGADLDAGFEDIRISVIGYR